MSLHAPFLYAHYQCIYRQCEQWEAMTSLKARQYFLRSVTWVRMVSIWISLETQLEPVEDQSSLPAPFRNPPIVWIRRHGEIIPIPCKSVAVFYNETNKQFRENTMDYNICIWDVISECTTEIWAMPFVTNQCNVIYKQIVARTIYILDHRIG